MKEYTWMKKWVIRLQLCRLSQYFVLILKFLPMNVLFAPRLKLREIIQLFQIFVKSGVLGLVWLKICQGLFLK
jgi:hypothetical protein